MTQIAHCKQKKLYTVRKVVDGITSSLILQIKTLLFPGKFRNDKFRNVQKKKNK